MSKVTIIDLLRLLVLVLVLNQPNAKAAESGEPPNSKPMYFIYNGPESAKDVRYDYHWEILRSALEATKSKWGDYVMKASSLMTEARQTHEMLSGSASIDTLLLDVRPELGKLYPVRIPVDRGLIGYRVMLIRGDEQNTWDGIKTIKDFKKHTIGQHQDWSDVQILKNAGFSVVVGSDYEGLFSMLSLKRFEAFSRGVTEVIDEFKAHQQSLPNLNIEKHVLLYYPMPMYFWFPDTPQGRLRAKRVQEGMEILIADGRYNSIFKKYFGDLISQLNLPGRVLFKISSPFVTKKDLAVPSKYFYTPGL